MDENYAAFVELMAAQARPLPAYVRREFEGYLRCGRLEFGFLRVACESCHAERLLAYSCKGRAICPSCGARRMAETAALLVDDVFPKQPVRQWVLSFPYPLRFLLASRPEVLTRVLAIVYRAISTHLIRKAGLTSAKGQTGAVTLIQRFGSAVNANCHIHALYLDGAYAENSAGKLRFHRVQAPTSAELTSLTHTIAQRLERQGFLERDDESGYLTLDTDQDDPMDELLGHSITYRVAVGPQAGRKVLTLQTLPAYEDIDDDVGKVGGFSLHAGVAAGANERDKLERLCRYTARPPVSEQRLSLTSRGQVRYELKTPYRDGTTHVVFTPLDFLAKLAALVPKPRANLVRYNGVFAPNSKLRSQVTPSGRGKGSTQLGAKDQETPAERRASLTWAQRLKRVFDIDVRTCAACGGPVKVIAAIDDPTVIQAILGHFESKGALPRAYYQPDARAPPQRAPFH